MKICKKCSVEQPVENYYKDKNCKDGRKSSCKKCLNAIRLLKPRDDRQKELRRRWDKSNPDKISEHNRRNQIKRSYGLTLDQYEAQLGFQNGVCALCEKPCASGRRLSVDHDHSTGKIRGLLCMYCNTAIGKLQDDPTLIRKVADYVENGGVMNEF